MYEKPDLICFRSAFPVAPWILLGLCIRLFLLLDSALIRTGGLPGDNGDCTDLQRSRRPGTYHSRRYGPAGEGPRRPRSAVCSAGAHSGLFAGEGGVSIGVIPCGRLGHSFGDRQSAGISACFFCRYCFNINLHDFAIDWGGGTPADN